MTTVPAAAAPNRRRARSKMKIMPLLVVAALAGAGWFAWVKTHPAADPNAGLLTATVTRGDLVEAITATGSVTAQTGAEVKIGSQVTGRIKKLNADVGTFVHKNEVIAELDLPDVQAQYEQAQANLSAAQTKFQQQVTGLPVEESQTGNAVIQARADVSRAQARLASAQAASSLQTTQTPTTIARAKSDVARAQAALSTAISAQKQVEASANLQIASAQEALNQAKANQINLDANLKRQQNLLTLGYVPQSAVDAALAQSTVNQSQAASAEQNIGLVQEKITADKQAASDTVAQARESLDAAQQALVAAQAGTYSDVVTRANVNDARQQLRQSQAALKAAIANLPQDTLKKQDIQQAADAVKAAQDQVAYAKAQNDKTFIRAPISGTVLQLAAQQGETLAAGLSAPTLIVVADLKRLQVDVFVDETDIGKVTLGQQADVQVDAFPDRIFEGKVTKIASGSTIQQGVVTYDVTVAINPSRVRAKSHEKGKGSPPAAPRPARATARQALKPDMTANVTIQTGKRTNVLLVPSEAVKVGKQGSTVNILVKKDGKTEPQQVGVKAGASDGVNTEIISGLKEGDVVIRAGLSAQGGRPGGPGGAPSPFGGAGGGGRGR